MFAAIGRFVDRYRMLFVGGWIAAAVLVTIFAPNLDEIATNDQSDFLPTDAPSIVALGTLETYFPEAVQEGNVTLVFDAGEGNSIQDDAAMAYIAEFSEMLAGEDAPVGIRSVLSPTLNPEAAGALISPDEQVAIVVLNLGLLTDDEVIPLIETLDEEIAQAPEGVTAYRSGQSAIFHDYNETITETVDRTLVVTLALVIVILLIIYRSPVSPLVPLTVVTIAYMVSRGIVAVMGDQGVFTVSGTAAMLLIVVMYGSGTDYCLFLINRFREELASHGDSGKGVRNTIHRVGESIASSAGTTVTGFIAMATAQLGLFNSAGPTLAIGIVTSLLAGLTLTPALLGLLGQRAFWPGRAEHRDVGAFYRRTSQLVSTRPLLTIIIIVAVMLPFAVYGTGQQAGYDTLADLPPETPSVAGFRVMEEHMGAGNIQPVSAVTLVNPDAPYADIAAISQSLVALDGVAAVQSATQPLGAAHTFSAGFTRLDMQLSTLAGFAAQGVDPEGEPTQDQIAAMTQLVLGLNGYLEAAAAAAPQLAELDAYDDALAAVQSTIAEQAVDPALPESLTALAEAAPAVYIDPQTLPEGVYNALGGDGIAALADAYLNRAEGAARFELILADNPFSLEAMDTALEIRAVFDSYSDTYGVSGTTAIQTDIRDILAEDMRFTIGLVLGGIFVVLMLMLRSVVAPTYLIGTILLSYGTTLGITRIVSNVFWDSETIVWWVPFFVFVFLVALGIDYSIFLFGRIKEEVRGHGIQEGIHSAVQATGSIITSAGIIVAGTFGALMAGDILGLAQVGFGVSVGILIDTFVVRTILDPALATAFGRWTWWPGGVRIDGGATESAAVAEGYQPLPEGTD